MSAKKRWKNSIWAFVTFFVVIFAVGLLIWGGIAPEERRQLQKETNSILQTIHIQESAAPEETPLPWYLVLINRDHPLPEDWTVEPKEVPGGQSVDARIYAPLMEMFEAAKSINLDRLPNVESGYRSMEKQQLLYDQKLSEFLKEGYSEKHARALTEKWVSVPGTSEHQLGLAVDISGEIYEIYPWLQENSWRYGFVLRYPSDKTAITGISGEEWHYRYVGVEAAKEMYEKGLCLEEYLGQYSP